MEETKQFTVKQSQSGDDSGYSCTSLQSKYSVKLCHSQSASSGDSCFDERRLTTSESAEKGKLSTLNTSNETQNQTTLRYVSGLETTTNQESNDDNLKSEQMILTKFEPQSGQLFSTDDLPSTSKVEFDKPKHLKEDTKSNREQNSTTFLHLANLCQSYHDHKNQKTENSNGNHRFTIKDTILKEVNNQEMLLKEIIESNEVHDDLFGVIVSMNDGLIINTSNSIQKNMGYPKDMYQGRSFVDLIHPNDRISFISYVTSVLTDPYTVSKQDGTSSVTFLKSKNNDGFYCNMQRNKGLNSGYPITQRKNQYQVCKLTTTFKDLSYVSASSSHLVNEIKISRSQLILIVNAQLVHSAYTYPEERPESPVNFITKHNALFEWCYVDHLIISHFGYLPQNIIGRSIFSYFKHEDITMIREVHENMIRDKSISYIGKPYRFKCQNGDFALVQTEWSNFVNPWSDRTEFFIGKHKVIQGPINPDVTFPVDDVTPGEKITNENKTINIFDDCKKVLNKNNYEANEASHWINEMTKLNNNIKKQTSKKNQKMGLCTNCLVKKMDASIQFPFKVEVQPKTCDSFSDHGSVMLGEISPHHNYENKSSSETPPSYTQLNYNNNIQRFFNSNLKTNSVEDLTDQSYLKEASRDIDTLFDVDMENSQSDTLLQNLTPSSNIYINNFSVSYSEQNSSKSSQQPLTQKILLQHNKIMEDDLVKQHKSNTKKNKYSGVQKQNVPEETKMINNIIHGVKRSNSSAYESDTYKLTKKKHLKNSNSTVVTQAQDNANNIVAATHTVARATQIWPPSQITRDSQTTVDLSRLMPDLTDQVHYYSSSIGNNVISTKVNEFEGTYATKNPCEQNQDPITNLFQSLSIPLYATVPMINHIPQNSQILQPYFYYQNQLLLQQPTQSIQFEQTVNPQSELQVPAAPNVHSVFYQKTTESQAFQVNQEEIITSSDSEFKREFGSFKSSNGRLYSYEDSSFYSLSLRDKTDSSDREDWPSEFNKSKFTDQFIKRQPFWMENIESNPDLIFRYQIELEDVNKILQRDMEALKTFTQPSLVKEQFRQLCAEMDDYDDSKINFEDGSTLSSEDDEWVNQLEHRERP
ncbi:period circadian protein isoform X2 [Sipha flava]|uniref:Period circadian protein n=1 Tax=Sipha flava TaxID=143950 RepID=A0A8B8G1S3_9HEMI|nr:period circadian protein isoform X2 [Sipha flava]